MEANITKLYSQLRKTKEELVIRLENHPCTPTMQHLLNDELQDVNMALGKITKGTYGTCEISGELIPLEILKEIPTIKSIHEIEEMNLFCRKPIY